MKKLIEQIREKFTKDENYKVLSNVETMKSGNTYFDTFIKYRDFFEDIVIRVIETDVDLSYLTIMDPIANLYSSTLSNKNSVIIEIDSCNRSKESDTSNNSLHYKYSDRIIYVIDDNNDLSNISDSIYKSCLSILDTKTITQEFSKKVVRYLSVLNDDPFYNMGDKTFFGLRKAIVNIIPTLVINNKIIYTSTILNITLLQDSMIYYSINLIEVEDIKKNISTYTLKIGKTNYYESAPNVVYYTEDLEDNFLDDDNIKKLVEKIIIKEMIEEITDNMERS